LHLLCALCLKERATGQKNHQAARQRPHPHSPKSPTAQVHDSSTALALRSLSCGTATAPDHRHRTGSDTALLCCLALHVLLDARGVLLSGVEVPVMVLVIFLSKDVPVPFLTAPGHRTGPQSVAQRATHLVPTQHVVLHVTYGDIRFGALVSLVTPQQ